MINTTNNDTLQKISSLNDTREQIIKFAFYATAVVSFIFLVIRVIEQSVEMVTVASLSLVSSLFFIFLCHRGYSQLTIIIAGTLHLSIAYFEGYQLSLPPQTIIYFSLIPAIIAFLISKYLVRIVFLSVSFLLLLSLNFLTQAEDWTNFLAIIIVLPSMYVIVMIFIQLMEKQEYLLRKAVNEKNVMLEQLASKHQDLQLINDTLDYKIRGPISTIKGFLDLLSRTNLTTKQANYSKFTANAAVDLENTIFDALQYIQIDNFQLSIYSIDVNKILDDIISSLKFDIEQKQIQLNIDTIPNKIRGNYEGIKTIFQNLMTDAIQHQSAAKTNYTPTITIEYSEEEKFDVFYVKKK